METFPEHWCQALRIRQHACEILYDTRQQDRGEGEGERLRMKKRRCKLTLGWRRYFLFPVPPVEILSSRSLPSPLGRLCSLEGVETTEVRYCVMSIPFELAISLCSRCHHVSPTQLLLRTKLVETTHPSVSALHAQGIASN